MHVKLILYFLALVLTHSASAQRLMLKEDPIAFDRLPQVKELSNHTVTSIVQDDMGFMWFGTLNGLIRFDGYDIKTYKNDTREKNSLANNSIQAIAKDKHGNLWIATQGGGLDRFELSTEKFYHYQYNPNDPSSISGNSLLSILVDSRGMIWTGTFSNGLNRLDPVTKKFIRITEDHYLPVRAISEDEHGKIWFSSDGINSIDPSDLTVKRFPGKESDPAPITTGGIRAISPSRAGHIWVATHDEEGLFRFDINSKSFIKISLPHDPVSAYSLLESKEGRLWLGTSRGLSVINGDTISHYQFDQCDPNSISKKVVLSLFQDSAGVLWLGMESGGVNKILPSGKFSRYFYPRASDNVTHNSIRSLLEDDRSNIWVGWVQGGIGIIDPATQRVRELRLPGIDNHTCLFQDTDKTIWAGTWGHGLLHLSNEGKLLKQYVQHENSQGLPDNRIQAILRDRSGILWIATENGLTQFDPATESWNNFKAPAFPQSLLGNNVQSLAFVESPDGSLWAGTWSGLNHISPDRKSVTHYVSDSSKASSDHVISLHFDKESDQVWIGTFGGGLRKLDVKTGAITYYTEQDGLPSNTIYAIEPDDNGMLWLSTANGVSVLDKKTRTFRNYDVTDGLIGNEFFFGAALKLGDGQIIFGGINGLNKFDPQSIKDNLRIPPIVVTDLEVLNKQIVPGSDSILKKSIVYTDKIVIDYDQSVVSFSFAALNYLYPEKSKYAYMLDGFDDNWNYIDDQRKATYTNINPGTYTFRVRGSNNDGVWNETGKSILVVIRPPFWLTFWFRMCMVLFVAGSLVSFYMFRMRVANKQRELLEGQVRERTQEIMNKNREILQQIEKVENLKDEIASQRDSIEHQNNLLATAKAELEQKVAERTLELSKSNQELMDQNVQLEQFAFMTAHNLRGPVARLLGLTSIFNSSELGDPMNGEVINRIQNSALDLDEVIRDIADILHVQKGIQRSIEDVEVVPAIERVLHGLRTEAQNKKIRISIDIARDTVIRGVVPYVHSVFYNLISNAIKYTDPRKEPALEIKSIVEDRNVLLVFADNGIGFDLERQREKLFKPFSRLNFTSDGKGLGLFLVKIQMDSMNGEIDISSQSDVGTTVRLKFVKGGIGSVSS